MTDGERQILDVVLELRRDFDALRRDLLSKERALASLSPETIVGADYVAAKFGCSPAAVVRGRFGTDKIPRQRSKPIAFVKRDVDRVFNQLARSTDDVAAELRHKAARAGRSK